MANEKKTADELADIVAEKLWLRRPPLRQRLSRDWHLPGGHHAHLPDRGSSPQYRIVRGIAKPGMKGPAWVCYTEPDPLPIRPRPPERQQEALGRAFRPDPTGSTSEREQAIRRLGRPLIAEVVGY
jgi:hypothetical protein